MSYRINVEHFDKSVEEKIENRDKNLYKSKASYVLAALKTFDEPEEKNKDEKFTELEEKIDKKFEEIKKIILENQNKKSGETKINLPSTEAFYEEF